MGSHRPGGEGELSLQGLVPLSAGTFLCRRGCRTCCSFPLSSQGRHPRSCLQLRGCPPEVSVCRGGKPKPTTELLKGLGQPRKSEGLRVAPDSLGTHAPHEASALPRRASHRNPGDRASPNEQAEKPRPLSEEPSACPPAAGPTWPCSWVGGPGGVGRRDGAAWRVGELGTAPHKVCRRQSPTSSPRLSLGLGVHVPGGGQGSRPPRHPSRSSDIRHFHQFCLKKNLHHGIRHLTHS